MDKKYVFNRFVLTCEDRDIYYDTPYKMYKKTKANLKKTI